MGKAAGDYETDILPWSEHQAALLRQLATGERPNETPDWTNIIEEIRAVGRSELSAVQSLLFVVLLHRLKKLAWPDAQASGHWDDEERAALVQARRKFQPGMRRRLDLNGLYDDAREALPRAHDGAPPQSLPETCPITLDELLPRKKPAVRKRV